MLPKTARRTITVAHSPDSDDAFMFYGLATNKLDTGDLNFTHLLKDIQTLNEEAMRGTYDVTAISFHAYAYIADNTLCCRTAPPSATTMGRLWSRANLVSAEDIPN